MGALRERLAAVRERIGRAAQRAGRDPAELDEAAVRAHLLTLKTRQNYAPSTMRAPSSCQLFRKAVLAASRRSASISRA